MYRENAMAASHAWARRRNGWCVSILESHLHYTTSVRPFTRSVCQCLCVIPVCWRDYAIFTPYLPDPDDTDLYRALAAKGARQDCCKDQYRDIINRTPMLATTLNGHSKEGAAATNMHTFNDTAVYDIGGAVQEEGVTALHSASSTGNLAMLQHLLAQGCSVDVQTRTGLTPLHCASGCGHLELVQALVRAGACVNLPGRGGRTALYMAAENGHHECVKALLQGQADVNSTSDKGLTPLSVCVLNNYSDLALDLLPHSAQCINVCDSANNLPLHYAVRNGNASLVRALLTAGSKKNVLNKNFESPVHVAVVAGNLEVLELLVEKGCDVNFCESVGNVTPLHVAVNMHSDIDLFRPMLKLLLRGGCILNWRAFSTLETPLYRSLGLEKTDMSCELLSHGADPNLASPFDITALQRACQKGSIHLIKLILSCGISWKRERWLNHYDTICRREVTDLIQAWKNQVVSLQQLCRIRVRQDLQENLEMKLNSLPLPQKVRNYILLRDLLL